MARTFGELVRDARQAAKKSLREVADPMGVSVPFLHDVEHGRRRLAPGRWLTLIGALPSLNVRLLAEAALVEGPVQIDARDLTKQQRSRLVAALEDLARVA